MRYAWPLTYNILPLNRLSLENSSSLNPLHIHPKTLRLVWSVWGWMFPPSFHLIKQSPFCIIMNLFGIIRQGSLLFLCSSGAAVGVPQGCGWLQLHRAVRGWNMTASPRQHLQPWLNSTRKPFAGSRLCTITDLQQRQAVHMQSFETLPRCLAPEAVAFHPSSVTDGLRRVLESLGNGGAHVSPTWQALWAVCGGRVVKTVPFYYKAHTPTSTLFWAFYKKLRNQDLIVS